MFVYLFCTFAFCFVCSVLLDILCTVYPHVYDRLFSI